MDELTGHGEKGEKLGWKYVVNKRVSSVLLGLNDSLFLVLVTNVKLTQ